MLLIRKNNPCSGGSGFSLLLSGVDIVAQLWEIAQWVQHLVSKSVQRLENNAYVLHHEIEYNIYLFT